MKRGAKFSATGVDAYAVTENALQIARQVSGVGPEVAIEVCTLGALTPYESNIITTPSSAHTVVQIWTQDFAATWDSPEVRT